MEHWTDKYLNIPYKPKGRSMQGLDCWGLVQAIYSKELFVVLPGFLEDYDDISRSQVSTAISKNMRDWFEVEKGQEQAFDVVVLNIRGLPTHVGVLVDPEKKLFIHVSPDSFVTIERLDSKKWYNRILAFMRLDLKK